MSRTVDIEPRHAEIIRDILRQNMPSGVRAWVFGSRANGTAEKYSDVDIALEGDAALDDKAMTRLEVAFEESALPYTIDIADLKRIRGDFKDMIDACKIRLPLED